MNGQNLEAIEKEYKMAHQQYHFFRASILAALHECFTSVFKSCCIYCCNFEKEKEKAIATIKQYQ